MTKMMVHISKYLLLFLQHEIQSIFSLCVTAMLVFSFIATFCHT